MLNMLQMLQKKLDSNIHANHSPIHFCTHFCFNTTHLVTSKQWNKGNYQLQAIFNNPIQVKKLFPVQFSKSFRER